MFVVKIKDKTRGLVIIPPPPPPRGDRWILVLSQ